MENLESKDVQKELEELGSNLMQYKSQTGWQVPPVYFRETQVHIWNQWRQTDAIQSKQKKKHWSWISYFAPAVTIASIIGFFIWWLPNSSLSTDANLSATEIENYLTQHVDDLTLSELVHPDQMTDLFPLEEMENIHSEANEKYIEENISNYSIDELQQML